MNLEQTWQAFMGRGSSPLLEEATEIAMRFGPEMRNYCELIQGPHDNPLGFMVRGEDASFTQRAQAVLRLWEIADDDIAYYQAMSEMFEHRRAFLKLEWHQGEDHSLERLAAFYFRRRPAVKKMIDYYASLGVQASILEDVALVAKILEKDSIHFVAGAVRPGHAVRHKLYFSQYVTSESYAAVLRRLLQVAELFNLDSAAVAYVAQTYGQLLSPERKDTLFVSLSFSKEALVFSLKIDYPKVSPQSAVVFLPVAAQPAALDEIQQACALAGRDNLAYLGVRLYQDRPLTLKYYLDLE